MSHVYYLVLDIVCVMHVCVCTLNSATLCLLQPVTLRSFVVLMWMHDKREFSVACDILE